MANNAARVLVAILKMVLPLLLLAGGIGSLAYGIAWHSADVSVEQEIEIDLAPPPVEGVPGAEGLGPPGFGLPGEEFGGPAPAGPPSWMTPPPELTKVKEKVDAQRGHLRTDA